MKNRKIIMATILAGTLLITGIAAANFGDRGEILGSQFSVGSADVKLLNDTSGGIIETNLADTLQGPSFTNIYPGWSQDYALKLYNNATGHLQLSSNAEYDTANDPDSIRSDIFVEIFNWNDADNDGLVSDAEIGSTFGRKTIIKWKTEGYDLGSLSQGSVKGLLLRFSVDTISDTKQGANAVFDFNFDSISLN